MKRFFIGIFLSCSMFLVMACFIRKANGKETLGFQYILQEMRDSKITFNIQEDISSVSTAISDLWHNNDFGGGWIESIVDTGETIYYCVKFFVLFIVHTLVATFNIIILLIRCLGFDTMNYIELGF